MKILNFLLVFLIFNFLFLSFPSITNAQQSSLSISPTLTELVIKPDQSASQNYILINRGDPTIVKIVILPFETRDIEGNINIKNQLESPIRFELISDRVKLDEPFFFKNDETEKFELAIRVPEGAPLKDYYFTMLAETQPPPAQEGAASIRAKIRVGSPLLIMVTSDGQIEIKPKISLFEVLPVYKLRFPGFFLNLLDSGKQIPIVLVVDNKGKNLIKPRGKITLRGPLGNSRDFEIKQQNVLAESQRKLNPETIPSGFFLGYYKLSTSITFGDETPTLFGSTSFVALPFKIILITLILLLLGVFLYLRTSHSNLRG